LFFFWGFSLHLFCMLIYLNLILSPFFVAFVLLSYLENPVYLRFWFLQFQLPMVKYEPVVLHGKFQK
jgi:hypothetical protein